MNQLKYLLITLLLLGCRQNIKAISDKEETIVQQKIENQEHSLEKDVQKFEIVDKSGLEQKKFYFLKGNLTKELTLIRYADDFEMRKYLFEEDKFINGGNVMEPSEWNVIEIAKHDLKLRYIVSMLDNNNLLDTLNFVYNPKKGILKHKIREGYNPIILIDSTHINNIKILDKKLEE